MGQREDDLRRINPGTFSDEQWKKIEADYDASAAAADANVAAEKAAAAAAAEVAPEKPTKKPAGAG